MDQEHLLLILIIEMNSLGQNSQMEMALLVFVSHESVNDYSMSNNWRISRYPNGSPGATDNIAFDGDENGDGNSNGIHDLMEYALVGTLEIKTLTIDGEDYPSLSYTKKLGTDDARIDVQYSNDLANWSSFEDDWVIVSEEYLLEG